MERPPRTAGVFRYACLMKKKDPSVFRARMTSRWKVGLFFSYKMPLALFAGLRITRLDAQQCTVTVPHGWRSTNPFKSTYFAAQSMAAELSTGAMLLAELDALPLKTGMLVKHLSADFGKRAIDIAAFTCTEGAKITAAVEEAVQTGAPVLVDLESVGVMPDGTEVSRFKFTWSVIAKQ